MQLLPLNTNTNVNTGKAVVSDGKQSQPLQGFGVGETVTAEVVESEGGVVTLKTQDGSVFKAEFPGGRVMLPGDTVELLLEAKDNGSIHLKLTGVNGREVRMGTGDLQVKLMDIGVQPSELNTKVAQFLVDRNIQPTPEKIGQLVKIATQFPELPAAVALFMVQNNIPANQKNVDILTKWLKGGDTLLGDAQALSSEVEGMIEEAEAKPVAQPQAAEQAVDGKGQAIKPGQPQAQEGGQPIQPVPAFVEGEESGKAAPLAKEAQDQMLKDAAAVDGKAQPEAMAKPADAGQAEGVTRQQGVNQAEKGAAQAVKTSEAQLPDGLPKIIVSVEGQVQQQVRMPAVFHETFMAAYDRGGQDLAGLLPKTAVSDFATTLSMLNEGEVNEAVEGFLSKFALEPGQKEELSRLIHTAYREAAQAGGGRGAQEQAAPSAITETAIPRAAAEGTQNIPAREGNAATVAQQQENQPANQARPAGEEVVAKEQAAVLTDANKAGAGGAAAKEMRQVIDLLEKFIVPLKREVAGDARNIEEALKNQQRAADSVHSSISRIAGETSGVAQRAAEMSSRIQMGNNLDNFYYCQIPVEINKNQTTAELYVFERKKGGNGADRTNTTILIALETENMGRVESVLRAEEDNLAIEFRVENRAVRNYLMTATRELDEALKSGEFEVRDIKVIMMETPASPLNVEKVLGEGEKFQLQTIDISV